MNKTLRLLFFLLASATVSAQNPALFNPEVLNSVQLVGVSGSAVNFVAPGPDGQMYVAGDIATYNGVPSKGIVRLFEDGSRDPGFALGDYMVDVRAFAFQPDGKMIIVGDFLKYNFSTPSKRIVRVNADGSYDATFSVGTGFDDTVLDVKLQPDGKILVCGNFTTYNGVGRRGVARLNSDGSLDTSFTVGNGSSVEVVKMALQTDGKILVIGDFVGFNGGNSSYVARLNADGSNDTSLTTVGFTDTFGVGVYDIVLQPDGKMLVCGSFETYGGQPAPGMVRMNANGTFDTAFSGSTDYVTALFLLADGKILSGQYENGNLMRHNADGSLDPSFESTPHEQQLVRSIAVSTSGMLVIGGDLYSNNIGVQRCFANGLSDYTFNTGRGFKKDVNKVLLQPDGKILACGDFQNYNGTVVRRIARLNTDGSLDTTFITGTGFDLEVYTMALQADGKILVGGTFTKYNGTAANCIIRLNPDGSVDNAFSTGTGFGNGGAGAVVHDFLLLADGKIIVVGGFENYNGVNRKSIIRLNPNGTFNNQFAGAIINGVINTIAQQADGKFIVGGGFTTWGANTASGIARLNDNGTFDNTFVTGLGMADAAVRQVAIQNDGKIIAVGDFYNYNGVQSRKFVRINPDGSRDASINTPTHGFNSIAGYVSNVILQPDGKIICGGDFNTYGGNFANNIVRIKTDGTYDASFTGFASIVDFFQVEVKSILLLPNNQIVMAGSFTRGSTSTVDNRITILNTDGSVDTSFNNLLGQTDFSQQQPLSLYPNPVKDRLYLSTDAAQSYAIFNVNGQRLLEGTAGKEGIDTSGLSNGMYLMVIGDGQEKTVRKFIKQ